MKVVGYLHNSDLLLEDEKNVMVIAGSHYVLTVGDRVEIDSVIDEQAKLYQVKISFASADHSMLHEDEIQVKFAGSHDALKKYLDATTVH